MAEWLSLSGQTTGGRPSVVEHVRHRLVEHEFWYGVGLGEIDCRSLIEEEVADYASRVAPGRARARWAGGCGAARGANEDRGHDGGLGDEGEDPSWGRTTLRDHALRGARPAGHSSGGTS